MSEGARQLELRETPAGVELWVQVTPRAGMSEVAGVERGALRIRVTAPPVEGAANRALVELLSEVLGVPKRQVRFLGGERSRRKCVLIEGLRADELQARIAARLGA